MLQDIILSALTVFIFLNIVFLIAQYIKDNSIIDIAWGLGFISIALVLLLIKNLFTVDYILIFSIILIWGFRLAIHIYMRHRGKGEDFRYKNWRKEWGVKAGRKAYIRVYMLQGIIMLLVAFPIIYLSSYHTNKIDIWDITGMIIFTIGFLFEAIGDYQLYRFKKNSGNSGKLIKTGLWKFTRHPNYFGEALLWWGIAMIAFEGQYGFFVFFSPIIINFLLIKISGIPMLEKKYEGNPEWEEYKMKTPAFIPFIKRTK